MLAELAAANAAFGILKQCVQNGREIADAAAAVGQFVGAKEALQRKAQRKGGGSDLEEFMALEKIKQQEEELKTIMIYAGRPGLWHDWQRFQAKARNARREAEHAAMLKRKKVIEGIIIAFFILCCLAVLGALVFLILHAQGKL